MQGLQKGPFSLASPSPMDKAKIVEQLRVFLLERIARTQHSIDEAIQSRNSDTKSSAGDKPRNRKSHGAARN